MANDPDFIQYVCDQIDGSCHVSYKHMFGSTTLYSKGKVVALICDNQLFVKPTDAGRAYIGDVTEAPAYKGSKNFFLIGGEIDDTEWLTDLIRRTEEVLPKPKPRKKKNRRVSGRVIRPLFAIAQPTVRVSPSPLPSQSPGSWVSR